MNENQKPVIWTVIIATLLILIGGIFAVGSIGNTIGNGLDVMNEKLAGLSIDEQAIANGIVAGIVMPTIPEIVIPESDTNRLCELTPGCEYWEGVIGELDALDNPDAREDFFDELSDLLDIDEDDETLVLGGDDMRDYQVRVYSDEDKDEENWEIQVFIRQAYDIVDEDVEVEDQDGFIYLLITSVLDEGEYDELAIEEVNRRFEFE